MGIPFTDLPECDSIQAWKTPRILSPGVDYPTIGSAMMRRAVSISADSGGRMAVGPAPYHTIIDPTAVSQGLGQ